MPFLALIALLAPAPAEEDFRTLGLEVSHHVRAKFFDQALASDWVERHRDYGREVDDPAAFAALTNRLLGQLGASHTGCYGPDDPEFAALMAIFHGPLRPEGIEVDGIGADFDRGRFVRVAFAGGPAEAAGLRRGDQVVEADGAPFHPVRSFAGKAGRDVVLGVRRQADADPEAVSVRVRRVDPTAEWAEALRLGARVIERDGRKVAYAPVFSGAGVPVEEILSELFDGPFAAADALVIDFRDGWGGCNPSLVDLFHRAVPVLESSSPRDGARRVDGRWRKPLVLLVNEGTRSGKEVVAFAVKKHRLGTLVGRTTAGAVLAGSPVLVRPDLLLYLAVADIRIDGERLEGKGVEPDVPVEDLLEHVGGADPQLERALSVAAGLAGG